ncbi:MAG: hypothetical protein IPN67_08560 [Bacteroidales bacterium]|nr:hypothetical protein [Bacteroidales bacterium]
MDQFRNHPLYMQHNIDTAMSSLWDFYKKRFIPLFLISFVMSLALQYISTYVNIQELSTITDPMLMLGKMKEMMVPVLIISLINLLFSVVLQYYILYNPLSSENNILVAVLKSMKYFVPYLIVMILLAIAASVAIILGILLLVVGVFFSILYVMTLYLFILPVMMAEEANIADTITRTIKLSHRNFWSNIGWVAVFLIILVVLTLIFSGIILLPFTGSFIKTIANPGETTDLVNMTQNPLFIILSALVGALTLPLIPLFSCILYFNARAREEMSEVVTIIEPEKDRVRVEDLYAKPYSDDHPDNPDNKG